MAFTFFFRDSQTLELAIDDALPSLRGRAFIHVWDAGCAHGPEPYTLAILLRERMSDYVFRNVHIHATDIDSSFAAQVTSGVFAEQEVKRVPPEILQKYFRPASRPGFVEVVPELRAKVAFSHHDLLSLRPDSRRAQPDRVQERAAALRRSAADRGAADVPPGPSAGRHAGDGAHPEVARYAGAPSSSKSLPTPRSTGRWSRRLWSIRPRTASPAGMAVGAWTCPETDRSPTFEETAPRPANTLARAV